MPGRGAQCAQQTWGCAAGPLPAWGAGAVGGMQLAQVYLTWETSCCLETLQLPLPLALTCLWRASQRARTAGGLSAGFTGPWTRRTLCAANWRVCCRTSACMHGGALRVPLSSFQLVGINSRNEEGQRRALQRFGTLRLCTPKVWHSQQHFRHGHNSHILISVSATFRTGTQPRRSQSLPDHGKSEERSRGASTHVQQCGKARLSSKKFLAAIGSGGDRSSS